MMHQCYLIITAENEADMLARVTGLLAAKAYPLISLAAWADDGTLQIMLSTATDQAQTPLLLHHLRRLVGIIQAAEVTDEAQREALAGSLTACQALLQDAIEASV